jgi:DNA-binding transcriptional MerR regulator
VRIGELAARTDVPTRMLRYYEEQGLLVSMRTPNGYRDYPEAAVERVVQIRGLLDAGLPTRIIRAILPCLGEGAIHVEEATPELIADLEEYHALLDSRTQCLARNRDAIATYLETVRKPA